MKWADLDPDPRMLAALDEADRKKPRSELINTKASAPKNQWSNRFANACARMFADQMRRHKGFKKLEVLPNPESPTEIPTFVAGGKRKKVDVLAATLASGLQVGISLKGVGFRDHEGLQFAKNLTGRTYELMDEMRVIHGYQASAFLVATYFVPIAATDDKKTQSAPSSFGQMVEHLRSRTGRLDPTLASQLERPDMSVVALYVPGDQERHRNKEGDEFEYADSLPRGVVRYFDVLVDPPRRGLPVVSDTYGLDGLIDLIHEGYASGSRGPKIHWADPE